VSEALARAKPLIEKVYAAALAAADPRRAVREAIAETPEKYRATGRVIVIAIGKAAATMAAGAVDALGEEIAQGIVITKDGHAAGMALPGFEIYEASHPIPDQRGVEATKRAIQIVESADEDDRILALISGGGSALFESPEPPVTLAELATVTDSLLRAGAAIDDLNAVRTPLSQVKGGGLLARAGRTRLTTMIVSDVLGDSPVVIASGPTIDYGRRDPQRASAVLERFGLWDRVPDSVRTVLSRDTSPTSPSRPTRILLIANNDSAVEAASEAAKRAGLRPRIVWRQRIGEAREQAIKWVDACAAAGSKVNCLVGGGELTVTVNGNGVGGRNTEFVLAAAIELKRRGNNDWIVASLATDGEDGPTGVAGGFLDAESLDCLGADPAGWLAENDSLAPLRQLGATVNPGPTGTNVNDIYLAIRVSALDRRPAQRSKLL
jgi:hydroxypyruvate reductase